MGLTEKVERLNLAVREKPFESSASSHWTAQPRSGLLMLPLEIRKLVFDHLIGGPGICISENGRCAKGVEVPTRYRTLGGRPLITCDHRSENQGNPINALYLMLVCRQFYAEVTDMLYATSRFIFHDAIAFLRFSTRLSPPVLHKLRSITLEAGSSDSSFFERPLRYWSDVEAGHEDAHRLPSLAAEYFNEPYYPSLLSRCLREPEYHYDVRDPQVPSTWGAVCQDLGKMAGLRVLNVVVALESMLVCHKNSVFDEARGMSIDQGQAEGFIFAPLVEVKRALGGEAEVELVVDWATLDGESVFESLAAEVGINFARARIESWKKGMVLGANY
ncbi:uncharacterized protein CC84DRAFT_1262386 [Paraphaeosphaeria sporulosa]|uniref:DUF7730 domain-containing protein n=1 Tax=Paraphaeosphaeria sporulosa TaxID=1460663 RepID=A0A177C5P8_9PLEO|nr:uncharacterized protein CC84DRAFT_1262386 [Paraphaeosphaeria sporulosa]OAG02471.1 hypothetical protein CC84DRAFT_1262386 [Paraphaeosphaeria sporulosa]